MLPVAAVVESGRCQRLPLRSGGDSRRPWTLGEEQGLPDPAPTLGEAQVLAPGPHPLELLGEGQVLASGPHPLVNFGEEQGLLLSSRAPATLPNPGSERVGLFTSQKPQAL